MNQGNNQDAVNLKPNTPETNDGRRDILTVNTWIFKVEQYLELSQLNAPNNPISDENQIRLASTFLKGPAAIWWYNNVSSGNVPSTWNDFKYAVSQEFIPRDHSKRARDRLRNLKQTKSVAKYLDDF